MIKLDEKNDYSNNLVGNEYQHRYQDSIVELFTYRPPENKIEIEEEDEDIIYQLKQLR